jgi:hypothetical protein
MAPLLSLPEAPTAVLYSSIVIPYTIAYLVHLPGTKALRVGLYPLGLIAGVWTGATIEAGPGGFQNDNYRKTS